MNLVKLHIIDKRIEELSKKLKDVAIYVDSLIFDEARKCEQYHYDIGAFEESCGVRTFKKRDFDSKTDCWNCKKRKVV